MNPSSMAWRISYLWNARGRLSGPAGRDVSCGLPNSIKVECFGVAVNAKWDRFFGRARLFWISVKSSSTVMFAVSLADESARVACSFEAVLPVCDVCASSMITAKLRSFNEVSVKIASIACGKVCSVTTMIGTPFRMASASCAVFVLELVSRSIAAIMPLRWSIC